jgi:tetratricopeptide (TPR) repeat protein
MKMKNLILALVVCLIPHAFYAQTVSPTSTAPVQDGSTSQADLEEAAKLNASVKQLYAAGNYKEALPLAERVLALLEKGRGDEDPFVGDALHNLATLYLSLKKFEKFETVFERILARREKSKIATSPATMKMLINFSCLIISRGRSNNTQAGKLAVRINPILMQDAVLAAGLPLPENLPELDSRVIFDKSYRHFYPAEAKAAGLQGTILMWAETDETGKIVKAEAVPCWQGQKPLADAAVEAVRAARLKPVVVNGKSIKLKVLTTYNFVLGSR